MPSLAELQASFAAAVLDGDERFLAAIAPGGADITERLAVYRNNARHNFREALRAVYPVVEMLVGEEFFAFAADHYAVAHPSASGDIHDYGGRFGDFLAGFEGAAGLAYLPDMARLEWAMHEVFHAADVVPCPLDQLAAEGCAAQIFVLSPACRLLHSPYPVDRLWALHQPGCSWDESFDLGSGAAPMLVRRDGYAVEIERLVPGEFTMLQRLAHGEALGVAYDAALRVDAAFDLSTFLLCRLSALVTKT